MIPFCASSNALYGLIFISANLLNPPHSFIPKALVAFQNFGQKVLITTHLSQLYP